MKKPSYTKAFITILLAAVTSLPFSGVVHAVPTDCSLGKSQNIVAHPDDDLFFVNPLILQDIHAGKCVESIYVTSGDAGKAQSYWSGRETGLRTAYAQMAGVSNQWTDTPISIQGHTLMLTTLNQKPQVTLVFLRIPSGGLNQDCSTCPVVEGYAATNYETMRKLWDNTISLVHPVDLSPAYTRQELIDTLAIRMATYAAPTIRTLDYTKAIDGADHYDHQSVAYFARSAHQQGIIPPHTFTGFQGYPVTSNPANVSGSDLTDKQNAYFAYDPYDSNTCTSVAQCASSTYPQRLDWLSRNYAAGSESGAAKRWAGQTVDGDAGSLSGYNADVGAQSASITFNNDLYTFYKDSTAGTLRMAKKTLAGTWSFTTLDGQGGTNGRISANVGGTPSAMTYNGVLQVFYYDATNGDLRHAMSADGQNWNFETLDGSPGTAGGRSANLGQTPTALTYGTSLQLFYYDATFGCLRHAWYDTSWHFQDLDGTVGSVAGLSANVGQNVSATVYGTTLQTYYYDATNRALRHAWSDATGWHFENLDGGAASVLRSTHDMGQHPTVVVNGDVLNVFYYDATAGDLRHAWSSSTQGWAGENLMGDALAVIRANVDVGIHSSAVVYNQVLHLFAYEQSNGGQLVHLWQDTSGWHEEPLDGFGATPGGALSGNIGMAPSPVVHNNSLQVFYYDATSGNLRQMAQ